MACFGAFLVGCAGSDGAWRPPPDAPKIGLKRGSAWSLMTLAPPHLVGPQFNMTLERGVLSGTISGGDAPGGGVHVEIKGDNAEGFGPHGPINIQIREENERTIAEGMWNGARVHLAFSSNELRGTVASNSAFNAKTNAIELFGMETFRRRTNPMADQLDPLPQNVSCEYFLRDRSTDGALNGGSICGGMPQDTRLEVPLVAQKWFTQAELVTVLVAVLSSPPPVNSERWGPRIQDGSPMYDTSTAAIDTARF
jgi:hypothetical protein